MNITNRINTNPRVNKQQSFGMALQKPLAHAAIDACGSSSECLFNLTRAAKQAAKNKFYDVALDCHYQRDGVNFIKIYSKYACAEVPGSRIRTNGDAEFLQAIGCVTDDASILEGKAQSILDLSV